MFRFAWLIILNRRTGSGRYAAALILLPSASRTSAAAMCSIAARLKLPRFALGLGALARRSVLKCRTAERLEPRRSAPRDGEPLRGCGFAQLRQQESQEPTCRHGPKARRFACCAHLAGSLRTGLGTVPPRGPLTLARPRACGPFRSATRPTSWSPAALQILRPCGEPETATHHTAARPNRFDWRCARVGEVEPSRVWCFCPPLRLGIRDQPTETRALAVGFASPP